MVEAPELETELALGADIGESLGPEPVLQADKDSVTPGASVEDQSSTRDEESNNVNVWHPGTLELLAQSCREEAREAAKTVRSKLHTITSMESGGHMIKSLGKLLVNAIAMHPVIDVLIFNINFCQFADVQTNATSVSHAEN